MEKTAKQVEEKPAEPTREELDAQKRAVVERVRTENDVPDKVIDHEGTKFIISADVNALSKADVEEQLAHAQMQLNDFDELVAKGRSEHLLKVKNLTEKLSKFN